MRKKPREKSGVSPNTAKRLCSRRQIQPGMVFSAMYLAMFSWGASSIAAILL